MYSSSPSVFLLSCIPALHQSSYSPPVFLLSVFLLSSCIPALPQSSYSPVFLSSISLLTLLLYSCSPCLLTLLLYSCSLSVLFPPVFLLSISLISSCIPALHQSSYSSPVFLLSLNRLTLLIFLLSSSSYSPLFSYTLIFSLSSSYFIVYSYSSYLTQLVLLSLPLLFPPSVFLLCPTTYEGSPSPCFPSFSLLMRTLSVFPLSLHLPTCEDYGSHECYCQPLPPWCSSKSLQAASLLLPHHLHDAWTPKVTNKNNDIDLFFLNGCKYFTLLEVKFVPLDNFYIDLQTSNYYHFYYGVFKY